MVTHEREKGFEKQWRKIPTNVHKAFDRACAYITANPNGPWPSVTPKHDSRRGRHRTGTFALDLCGGDYRALCERAGDRLVWYWIGTHNDYENILR